MSTYLVFGDLHGRVLPAFQLARSWQREHGEKLDGLLQVGDLGYFPDVTRLDKATKRHAEKDPLELGVRDVVQRTRQADALFNDPETPPVLWFTAGNHEDHEVLESLVHGAGCTRNDFPVDYYQRVRCIRDGCVLPLPSGPRIGALWGIDDQAPNARRKTPPKGKINPRSATHLAFDSFDVLLTHEAPRDAIFPDSGSAEIRSIIEIAQPAFAFFGHYHTEGQLAECDFGKTQVFHMHGLEFRGEGHTAEDGSVGVLRWTATGGTFEYLPTSWLSTITRHNWQHR
jgi:hypothetical protein